MSKHLSTATIFLFLIPARLRTCSYKFWPSNFPIKYPQILYEPLWTWILMYCMALYFRILWRSCSTQRSIGRSKMPTFYSTLKLLIIKADTAHTHTHWYTHTVTSNLTKTHKHTYATCSSAPWDLTHTHTGAHTQTLRPQRNFLVSYKTDNGMCPSGSGKSEVTYEPPHSSRTHIHSSFPSSHTLTHKHTYFNTSWKKSRKKEGEVERGSLAGRKQLSFHVLAGPLYRFSFVLTEKEGEAET